MISEYLATTEQPNLIIVGFLICIICAVVSIYSWHKSKNDTNKK